MPRSIATVTPPWDPSRPSIYRFIVERLEDDGSLGPHPPSLPDEAPDPSSITFGAGSLDGISRHWAVAKADDEVVTSIISALVKLARRPGGPAAKRLYDLVSATQTLRYVDKVLEFLPSAGVEPGRLRDIGEWLAGQAPDRSAVKFGIALMGVSPPAGNDLLLTLGAHDEFTLYSAVALGKSGAGERGLFELAKQVHGWGRIEIVERLANTTDPEIKHWMLIEGFKNSIMYEYLALICARTGDLLGALTSGPSDELIDAAGEMIEAMLVGQPGPPPSEYADLVPALQVYVTLIGQQTGTLAQRQVVQRIRGFVTAPGDVPIGDDDGEAMIDSADDFLARPHFVALAESGLLDPDHRIYWAAKSAADDLGIDIYEAAYTRITADMDDNPVWFDLMAASDDSRIERTLDLARAKLDLEALATGPQTDLGLGPDYAADSDLGWILQDLRRFPSHGWDLVKAGLGNRVVRNRNMAIRVLQSLDRSRWPDDAAETLRAAIDAEVSGDVRQFASDVLRGEVSVEEAWSRAIAKLREGYPEMAELAGALSQTPQGRRLRAGAGFGAHLSIWEGAYDTQPTDTRSISVTRDRGGFDAHIREANRPPEPTQGTWTREEAVASIAAMMNRLLAE